MTRPRNRAASPNRSNTESNSAPKGRTVLVNRARAPSIRSKALPARNTMPPANSQPPPAKMEAATHTAKPRRVMALGVSLSA